MERHQRLTRNCPELPEEIIQHIQSFLLYKEAAQTSVVSKSWFNAWCTRPIILLLGYDFDDVIGFWNYAATTVQRCIDLNVKVDKLALYIPFVYNVSLIDNLVVDILRLRIKVIEFCFYGGEDIYVLPAQVFANKFVEVLFLKCCKVDNLVSRNVVCPKLTTLNLCNVSIEDSAFKDILVGSPVIQSLTLSGKLMTGLKRINAYDLRNLETLIVQGIVLEWHGIITSSVICGQFLNLSRMVLKDVNVDFSFFTNLSSRFPKLEDLTLKRINYVELFRISSLIISSTSIKRLTLKHSYLYGKWNMASFEVPNIRKFKFSGDYVPPISFTSSPEEWETVIKLSKFDEIMIWPELRDLRRKLGRSKISLQFVVHHDRVVTPERDFEDIGSPAVKELMYCDISREGYNFFIECVLSFRPKLVNYFYNSNAFDLPLLLMYDNFLNQKKDSIFTTTYGFSFFLMNDLLEVSVEFFDDSLKEWQSLNSSLHVQNMRNYKAEQLRLKLEWESSEQTIIRFVEYFDED